MMESSSAKTSMWLILKKFDFVTVKTTSTLMEPNKALVKDEEADNVDLLIKSPSIMPVRGSEILDRAAYIGPLEAVSKTVLMRETYIVGLSGGIPNVDYAVRKSVHLIGKSLLPSDFCK
ncbi:hypothetical protein Tco_0772289 [Tanacetum coccineum]|uniref:Uncharacterized protein n=1 Tax=Tanacetum coccineum TaxID=301880 RepID=A0ABQ4ZHH0_9ASTR